MSDTKRSTNVDVPPLELIQDSPDSSDDETVTETPESRAENVGIVNQNDRDISPESGIDLDSRGDTGLTEKESTVAESTDRTVVPPNQMFNFDLTNPEEVVKMLESVNLTDEDTDVLLQEAYNVNMKLKEILRRKDKSGGKLNPSDAAAIRGTNVVVVPGPGPSKASASNSRANSASKKSQFSKTAPLPPISNGASPNSNMRVPSAVYSAKLNRPVPPSANPKRTALSSYDKRVGGRNPSASTMHKPPKNSKKSVPVSSNDRPDWNDRFMY